MSIADDEKLPPVLRLVRNGCLFCRKPLGLGPGEVPQLISAFVTEEGGSRRFGVMICQECFDTAEQREMWLEEKERTQNGPTATT